MAVALLIMLIFHTDAREGTCKMPLHLWTQVECVLLLFSVLMGLAFETYLRLQELDGNPVTSLSSRNFLQYIHFLSQFTFAMMFVWMVLGAFWALTTEASNSCRMFGPLPAHPRPHLLPDCNLRLPGARFYRPLPGLPGVHL